MKDQIHDKDALHDECQIITGYLLGQPVPSDLIPRYVEANAILFTSEVTRSELAVVAFVRRNPWSLPYLDAVLGLLRPNTLLRSKILLMIAILEATPQFTEAFIPESFSMLEFVWRISGCGASSMVKFCIGLFIYPFAVNAR